MTKFEIDFDINQYAENANKAFDPLPVGWYEATIVKNELVTNKKGNGEYMKISFSIADEKYKGRVVFANLNIRHPNNVTVEIARGYLSLILTSVGLIDGFVNNDIESIVGKTLQIYLAKREHNGETYNDVKNFKVAKEVEQAVVAQQAKEELAQDEVIF